MIPIERQALKAEIRAQCPERIAEVKASAGKKDSSAISESVISTGVPKIVVVLRKESVPCSVRNRKGTTTPAYGSSSNVFAGGASSGSGKLFNSLWSSIRTGSADN